METIAATFTFASFNGLSTAFVDYLYHNLKIIERYLVAKHKMAAFNGNQN